MLKTASAPLVLVVEDHPDTQSAVAAYLEEFGYEVVVASDGNTAMDIVFAKHPALVYLDLNLPHISGYDVCEKIRSDARFSDVAILMTSARRTPDVRAYALEAGADDYLPKPYELEELCTCLAELLRSKERLHRVPAAEPPADELKVAGSRGE